MDFLKANLGIYYILISSLLFAVTGAFAKILSADLPSIEVVFFRNLVGLFIVIFALVKKPANNKGGAFWILQFRGFIGAMAVFAFFYNIAHINLATAFTFSKTSPIFVAIIAVFLFKEKLSIKGWASVFVGFIGILLIVQPNLGISKTDWIGLWSGLGAALAYSSIKQLKSNYDARTVVLSFLAWGSAVPLVSMFLSNYISYTPLDFLFSPFKFPNLENLIFILLMGISGYYFQIYLTKAYSTDTKAGVIAAVSYADVIFTIFLGMLLGDSLPNFIAICGITLVILSVILIAKER